MTLGVFFIIVFGVELAYEAVWLGKSLDGDDEELIGHPVRFNNSLMIAVTEADGTELDTRNWKVSCIIFMALICAGDSKIHFDWNYKKIFRIMQIIFYF